ncbi:MAG: tryptophan--tRNA ligase [Thermoleophilia bacterium]|nr:tryptophan--tRNA ligase [Thermoleophilia bacterium]
MRIFSGIQPTGRKHLGNCIGAISQYVHLQEEGDPAIYCVVDLHAITVGYDPADLRDRLYDTTAVLLASGLDPQRCILFRQSDVPEHTELTWMLAATATAHGDLNRMHQFKEKSVAQRELVSAGLFFYPVLMAADILAYNTDLVPVGDDQRQHVELAREIASKFNSRFGDTFTVPDWRIPTVGARIMDLQSPENKMSTTSASESGTIFVLDEPKTIEKKIKSAVTDSGSEVRRGKEKPGISNLIEILAVVRGVTMEDVEAEFADARYGEFKQAVADAVIEYLAPMQAKYAELRGNEAQLEAILAAGAEKAGAIAGPIVASARDKMGLGRPVA